MQSITIASQHYTKRAATVKLPYLDEVSGFYLFGGSANNSLTNLAFGASTNLTAVAAPTYGANYAVIDGTNGFDTGLLLDEPFTQIIVGLQMTANAALAMTARGAANGDNFVDMMRSSSASPYVADGWPDGVQHQTIDGLNASAGYRMYAQSWQASKRHTIWTIDGTTVTLSTSSVNIAKTTTPTHTLKFGTGYTAGGPVFRLAAAILWPTVANPQKAFAQAIALRAILLARSITML